MIKNEKGGILCIDKPKGFTSQDAVNVIRGLYKTKQAGHTGTLDPMATGVLLVLVGRAVKASEYLMSERKVYRAGIKLGVVTDTQDITGKTLFESNNIPTKEVFIDALSEFVGDIMQIPPMYSAIKKDGHKLIDLARKGIEVEREARQIHIDSLTVVSGDGNEYILDVECSKGTYIRTLCHDIGQRLSCGAVMSSLERISNGRFDINDTHTIDELRQMGEEERSSILIPVESAFENCPIMALDGFNEHLAKNGAQIYLKKTQYDFPVLSFVRMYDSDNDFFALGQVKMFDEGKAVKPVKFL